MKLKLILFTTFISMFLFVSCNDSKVNGDNSQNNTQVETKEEVSQVSNNFEALNKTYVKKNNISENNEHTEIFNSKDNNDLEKYVEVKFATDLIETYLGNNDSMYKSFFTISDKNIKYQITQEEKQKLSNNIMSLKSQMSISNSEPIYFKPQTIYYEGSLPGIKDSAILKVKGLISKDNINYQSLLSFKIMVIENENKLFGNIE